MMKRLLIIIALCFVVTPLYGYADFIQTVHPDIPGERAEAISSTIKRFSTYYDIPSDVVVAIMWTETRFRNARSEVDVDPCSAGYLQIQRTTASAIYHQELTCRDLIIHWRLNIQLGVKYLRLMYDKTNHLAGAIGRYNGVNNLDYVREVLNKRHQITLITEAE